MSATNTLFTTLFSQKDKELIAFFKDRRGLYVSDALRALVIEVARYTVPDTSSGMRASVNNDAGNDSQYAFDKPQDCLCHVKERVTAQWTGTDGILFTDGRENKFPVWNTNGEVLIISARFERFNDQPWWWCDVQKEEMQNVQDVDIGISELNITLPEIDTNTPAIDLPEIDDDIDP